MCDLPLSAIAEINPTVRIPKGLTGKDAVSFIPMGDVSESGHWTFKQIRPLKFVTSGFTAFEEGDLLVAKITPCLENGKGAHAVGLENGIGFGSTEFHVLRTKPGNAQRFVFHLTQWRKFRHAAEGQMAGSAGQQRVPRSFFDEFLVANFEPDEQSTLAKILDALDTAIHETEAIIAKLKAVKQGLLHDLLTRGIAANGEIRPPQTEAPHLYKPSPLGWIPKEWDVVRVGEDADIEHGFAFPGHQFTDKEIGPALLVPGNFHREGGLYFTAENTKYFSGKYPQQYVLSRGDVLVVMTDLSPMTLILGRTVVLVEEFKALHNQRIGKFRFKKDGLWDATFFAETLSQDAVRLKVIAEATGTTVRHTSPDRIKSCYVARPKLQEQQLAAQRIAIVDLRRKREKANLLKLRQTKSGLMDDLLTGRVRVTPLLAEAAQQQGSE